MQGNVEPTSSDNLCKIELEIKSCSIKMIERFSNHESRFEYVLVGKYLFAVVSLTNESWVDIVPSQSEVLFSRDWI